jgi:nucleotide-binding universal stress UspA family protein
MKPGLNLLILEELRDFIKKIQPYLSNIYQIRFKMKKVLIALDYNPVSEKVVDAGYKLAKQMDAEVVLMHVVADVAYYGIQYPTFMGYEGFDTSIDLNLATEMRNVAKNYLETVAKHLNDPSVVTQLGYGDAADEILKYSEEWKADVIVLGTHSHNFLEKLLLGDVASRVLKHTKIPVFMVPAKK